MQPKLSICIPTYNRAKYLSILLKSILNQYEKVKDNFELIISDNASTDSTEEVVTNFMALGLNLKYLKKLKNTGFDGNFITCFIEAQGEYVWIIGDDEIVVDGAIPLILKKLEAYTYGVVYVSSVGYSHTIPEISLNKNNLESIEFDRVNFCKKINVFLTFISGNIFNKNIYLKYKDYSKLDSYYGTNIIQLTWIYLILTKADKFLFIKDKLIIAKTDSTGGYKLFETFATNQSKIAAQELKDYPKLIKYIEKSTLLIFFPQWINLYLEGKMGAFTKDSDPFITLKNTYEKYIEFWVFVLPLKFMPGLVRKIWVKLINKVSRMFL